MMTTQSNPRIKEIQTIWQQYQGLYVVVGIFVGLIMFPFLELLINDLSQLLIGLVPEAIGIGFTVFFLDRIYKKRDEDSLKKRLIGEASSRSNETAKSAIDWMRREGWLTGDGGLLINANLSYANLENANLEGANLKEADLSYANLNGANLRNASLTNTRLFDARLIGTDLSNANLNKAWLDLAYLNNATLTGVNLTSASLSGCNLAEANISHANLMFTNLLKANLKGSQLDGTNLTGANLQYTVLDNIFWESTLLSVTFNSTLPNGKLWTVATDTAKFTNRDHSEFKTTLNEINTIRKNNGLRALKEIRIPQFYDKQYTPPSQNSL